MNQEQTSRRSGWPSPHMSIVVLVLLAVISFFMLTEHRLHLFRVHPYLLLTSQSSRSLLESQAFVS